MLTLSDKLFDNIKPYITQNTIDTINKSPTLVAKLEALKNADGSIVIVYRDSNYLTVCP